MADEPLVGVSSAADLGRLELGVVGETGAGVSGERAVLMVCCNRVKKETAILGNVSSERLPMIHLSGGDETWYQDIALMRPVDRRFRAVLSGNLSGLTLCYRRVRPTVREDFLVISQATLVCPESRLICPRRARRQTLISRA